MKSAALVFWLGILVVGSIAYGSWYVMRQFEPQPEVAAQTTSHVGHLHAAEGGPIAGFKLVDSQNQPFDTKQLKGKVWVASVFFTGCAGTCWRMNQALADLRDQLKDQRVDFVSLTCDPKNDTPEAMKTYAEKFHADPAQWHFVTGDLEEIKKIGQRDFQIGVDEGTHTNMAVAIDRQGRVRGHFRVTDPDELKHLHDGLLKLLAEDAPSGSVANNQ